MGRTIASRPPQILVTLECIPRTHFGARILQGILDPLRVTRSALQNAASIAGLMLTTEVMITKIDEDDKKSKVAGSVA